LMVVVEWGVVIPEWHGVCRSDTLWMSYGWMKFVVLEFHPLILHAS
jgi:hypothetical protein